MSDKTNYWSTRCQASIEIRRDTFVPCGLKLGHKGSHKPMKVGRQVVS